MLDPFTGAGTTALGLAFALIVTRTGFAFKRTLRVLTVLPIITPPFVIGLALILVLPLLTFYACMVALAGGALMSYLVLDITAAQFISRIRRPARRVVSDWTGIYQYTIDQLLEKIIQRCRELNLRLTDDEETAKVDFMVFLTVQTMNYLHGGRHRVAL